MNARPDPVARQPLDHGPRQGLLAVVRRHGPHLAELAVLALAVATMGSLYFLPMAMFSVWVVVLFWTATVAVILRWVGKTRFPELFFLCLFFFPKKTVAADWWGGLLNEYFGPSSPVVLSFYDTILVPTLVVTGLWIYRGVPAAVLGKRYALAAGTFTLFACAGAVRYMLSDVGVPLTYAPVVAASSIGTGACYLLAKVLADRPAVVEDIFARYAKWLVVLLFAEYAVASSGLEPAALLRFSLDYRGAFRSGLLGYGVYVSFFGMLGFSMAVRDYLAHRRGIDLLVVTMGLVLVFATYERAALFASSFFVLLVVFVNSRHRWYGLLILALVTALVVVETSNHWNHRYTAVGEAESSGSSIGEAKSSGSSLSIQRAKGGSFLNTSSLVERFALQLRAVDVFLDTPLTGYGTNSYFMTSVSGVAPRFGEVTTGGLRHYYENVVQGKKQSIPHNILVQVLAETGIGVLPFLGFALVFPLLMALRCRPKNSGQRESLVAAVTFLLMLHAYFTFQSTPSYYFIFVVAASSVCRLRLSPGSLKVSAHAGLP